MSGPGSSTRRLREEARRRAAAPPRSFERWIESALAYVPSVAKRYVGCGVPFDELLAAGNLGLVEAALRFDPDRGVKFVTYADWWIRKTILKAIQEQSGAVRLPRYRLERIRTVQDVRRRLRARHGHEPTVEQIAEAGGLDVADVRTLLQSAQSSVSLDQPVSDDGSRSLVDTLPARRREEDPESIVDADFRVHVQQAVQELDSRERMVLALRFGFLGNEPMTLREVGKRLRLSRERIRQIESRALHRLRALLARR